MTQLYDNLYKTIGLILAENGETRTLSLLRIVNKVVSKAVSNIDEPLVFEYDSSTSMKIYIVLKCTAFTSFGDGNTGTFKNIIDYEYREKDIYRIKIYRDKNEETDNILFRTSDLGSITKFITLGNIGITNLNEIFYASDFNGMISPNFNTANITTMECMFCVAQQFNQPIGHWDTSNVTNMANMFDGATEFNQPIGRWDVSQATNMHCMFYEAESFNQPIGRWRVSNVTNMSYMFYGAKSFNQPISNWDVSQVRDMGFMFSYAHKFNQPLEWSTDRVHNMESMFENAQNFNQKINWNTSRVKNMDNLFEDAGIHNQSLEFDVSSMDEMIKIVRNMGLDSQKIRLIIETD